MRTSAMVYHAEERNVRVHLVCVRQTRRLDETGQLGGGSTAKFFFVKLTCNITKLLVEGICVM
jgi:hypothetical protein